jgi:hypothetical protein
MPNHYHLLIQQLSPAPVYLPLLQVWSRYSRYYNKRYQLFGSVFNQKLQHVEVSEPEHLLALTAYIHLNPVQAGLVKSPNDWPWSDFLDWMGRRDRAPFDPRFRDAYYSDPQLYGEIMNQLAWNKLGRRQLIDNEQTLTDH